MDPRIIEGIEACRPRSDDLKGAELSDVARQVEQDADVRCAFQRVQAWDAAISAAMDQVPLPLGLAERIVDRLQASAAPHADSLKSGVASAEATIDAEATAAAPTPPVTEMLPTPGPSRQRWLSVSSALAVAAGLLVAAYLGGLWPQPSETPLVELADQWRGELDAHPAGWRNIAQAPAAFPLPGGVLATAQSWQPISQGRGVAYKLVHAKGGEAILYAVRVRHSALPAAPGTIPQSTTGGKAVGYWQSGPVIYVLVVPGDERSYRLFISGGTTPLA